MDLDKTLGPIPAAALRHGIIIGSLLLLYEFLTKLGMDVQHNVFLMFTAIVVSAAILPGVRFLKRWHIPKALGISLMYLAIVSAVIGVVVLLIPLLTTETRALVEKASTFAARISTQADRLTEFAAAYRIHIDLKPETGFFRQYLAPHIEQGLGFASHFMQQFVTGTLHIMAALLVVLLFAFFLTEDPEFLEDASASTADDEKGAATAVAITTRVMDKIGRAVRAQLLIALVFGACYGTALWIYGIPFAITIGAAAVVLELIPYVGGITAFLLAVLVSLTQFDDPRLPLLWVVGSFCLITIATHKFLSPKLMESFLGIHKLEILIFLVIFTETWGIRGALLAVPAAIVWSTLRAEAREARLRRKARQTDILGTDGRPVKVTVGDGKIIPPDA